MRPIYRPAPVPRETHSCSIGPGKHSDRPGEPPGHNQFQDSDGIGTRVVAESKGIRVAYDHTTPDAGLAQSIGPVILGLGKNAEVDLLHLSWPDVETQCVLNVTADEKRTLAENNRKTGSCPVLFTWNGERFVCLGDFLGGGGLGYLVASGVCSQPDRDEAVAIILEQLRPQQGIFRLSLCEPMDEVAYLDHLNLIEPLPWRAMPDFPFPAGYPRPASAAHESYLRDYQTRSAGPGQEAFPPAHCGPRLLGWWTGRTRDWISQAIPS